jgi:hypothetical protein
MSSRIRIFLCISLASGLRQSPQHDSMSTFVNEQFPFYHSGDSIHSSLEGLSKSCSAPMKIATESCGSDCSIDIVDIGESSNERRIFYLFGEHARELISPETALAFIKELCSPNPSLMVKQVLKTTRFRIIPNGNPTARRLVEQGQFCLRANMNGVDLNRNWDAFWTQDAAINTELNQVNPGKYPFSEKETQIFKEAVVEFQPNVFAAIHSGTLGMYMPWAYSKDAEVSEIRNWKRMDSILSELDSKFCQCPSGGAAKEVGYDSPGTCLDWVHKNTKSEYSYAFEIFTGLSTDELRQRFRDQQKSFRASSFIEEEFLRDNCFSQFNPETKEDYDRTVSNWSNALIELAVLTGRK